jgi:hypothetical protein
MNMHSVVMPGGGFYATLATLYAAIPNRPSAGFAAYRSTHPTHESPQPPDTDFTSA